MSDMGTWGKICPRFTRIVNMLISPQKEVAKMKTEDLVVLSCDGTGGLSLSDEIPEDVTLFLDEGHWSLRGFLFDIGTNDQGRLRYSDHWDDPIGIYDRTDLEHLQEMTRQIESFTEKRLTEANLEEEE